MRGACLYISGLFAQTISAVAGTVHDALPKFSKFLTHVGLLMALASSLLPVFSRAASAIQVLKQSYEFQANSSSFTCDITDNIRRHTTPYYRRTSPDGIVEKTVVLSVKPVILGIHNKQGYWTVDRNEAVQVAYGLREQPNCEEDVLNLHDHNGEEVHIEFQTQGSTVPSDCQVIEASLSDSLTARLAEAVRGEHKSSAALKKNPALDMRQYVAKRRLFWIGARDRLLYRYMEYDGNGDLLSDLSFSNQELNHPIPDEIFAIPQNWPIFVALTPDQLRAHQYVRSHENREAAWNEFVHKVNPKQSSVTNSIGTANEGKASLTTTNK